MKSRLERKDVTTVDFGFFRAFRKNPLDIETLREQADAVVAAVSEKTGIDRFIRISDTEVAFSGTAENPALVLVMYLQRHNGEKRLCAGLNDEYSWLEWDFAGRKEFIEAVSGHIAARVNRTVKTVTEIKKHKYLRETVYLLDESSGEWQLLSDSTVDAGIIRSVLMRNDSTETVVSYSI